MALQCGASDATKTSSPSSGGAAKPSTISHTPCSVTYIPEQMPKTTCPQMGRGRPVRRQDGNVDDEWVRRAGRLEMCFGQAQHSLLHHLTHRSRPPAKCARLPAARERGCSKGRRGMQSECAHCGRRGSVADRRYARRRRPDYVLREKVAKSCVGGARRLQHLRPGTVAWHSIRRGQATGVTDSLGASSS